LTAAILTSRVPLSLFELLVFRGNLALTLTAQVTTHHALPHDGGDMDGRLALVADVAEHAQAYHSLREPLNTPVFESNVRCIGGLVLPPRKAAALDLRSSAAEAVPEIPMHDTNANAKESIAISDLIYSDD
jgi:hypothetical protein